MVWVWGITGAIAGIFLITCLIGLCLPKDHHYIRAIKLSKPPDEVFAVIANPPDYPAWQSNVKSMTRQPDRNGHEVWLMKAAGGPPFTLEITENVPPKRRVSTIADDAASFTGRWEFDLAPDGPGTRLTLAEHGSVPFPLFRAMVRLFGAKYVEDYLRALAKKLGESASIERLTS